jgi:hypothetical protein
MTFRCAAFAFLFLVVPATLAHAQIKRPIAPFVFDIRAFYAPLGQDPTTAGNLGLQVTDLPTRGLGGVAGLHLYPLRRKTFALGIGAEYLLARGRRTPEPDDSTTPPTPSTKPIVEQRLTSFTPQLSLNFGHREGWSYLTAGSGPMTFETFTGTVAPLEKPLKKNTINMGGGARWFATPHIAFTFDVRYYLTRPLEQTPSHPGRQRNRIRVLSAGISIR